jgi:hypothetical protein
VRRTGGSYLRRSNNERIPIHPRQHIKQQLLVRRDGVGYQFAVLWVQGEGGGGRLAGLYGASKEVEG